MITVKMLYLKTKPFNPLKVLHHDKFHFWIFFHSQRKAFCSKKIQDSFRSSFLSICCVSGNELNGGDGEGWVGV